jgi:hypothetical protein
MKKAFAITSGPGGIHINPTAGKTFPRLAVYDYYDTYEEAKEVRDRLRENAQTQKSLAAQHWHEQFTKAYESGNLSDLNKLTGIA